MFCKLIFIFLSFHFIYNANMKNLPIIVSQDCGHKPTADDIQLYVGGKHIKVCDTLSICIFVSVYMPRFVSFSLFLIYLSIFLSLTAFFCLSICLSLFPSFISIYPSVSLCASLFVYLLIFLSIFLSLLYFYLCLSLFLSVYLRLILFIPSLFG